MKNDVFSKTVPKRECYYSSSRATILEMILVIPAFVYIIFFEFVKNITWPETIFLEIAIFLIFVAIGIFIFSCINRRPFAELEKELKCFLFGVGYKKTRYREKLL